LLPASVNQIKNKNKKKSLLSPSQAHQAHLSCCVRRRTAAPSIRHVSACCNGRRGGLYGRSAMEVEKAKCEALDRHVAFVHTPCTRPRRRRRSTTTSSRPWHDFSSARHLPRPPRSPPTMSAASAAGRAGGAAHPPLLLWRRRGCSSVEMWREGGAARRRWRAMRMEP